jgi:hypothetical protein
LVLFDRHGQFINPDFPFQNNCHGQPWYFYPDLPTTKHETLSGVSYKKRAARKPISAQPFKIKKAAETIYRVCCGYLFAILSYHSSAHRLQTGLKIKPEIKKILICKKIKHRALISWPGPVLTIKK